MPNSHDLTSVGTGRGVEQRVRVVSLEVKRVLYVLYCQVEPVNKTMDAPHHESHSAAGRRPTPGTYVLSIFCL